VVAPQTSYKDSSDITDLKSPTSTSGDDVSVSYYANGARRFLDKAISVGGTTETVGASSVYMYGYYANDTNIDTKMTDCDTNHNNELKQTSHMDYQIGRIWNENPTFINAYIGTEGCAMYRVYPGRSGYNASGDYWTHGGVRLFNPKVRGWYAEAKVMRKGQLHYTEPYVDATGKGFMISIATPMYASEGSAGCATCSANPAKDSQANTMVLKGVVSTDVSIGMLQAMIDKIKSGKTGQAHLIDYNANANTAAATYQYGGVVVASPQWDPWTAGEQLFYTTDIVICPAVSASTKMSLASWNAIKAATATSTEAKSTKIGGCFVEYLKLEVGQDGAFILLISTPLAEITYSIDQSASEITASANGLFASTAVTCVICFLFILASIAYTAHQIAAPLAKSARIAAIIGSNIGSGDLFEGVDIEQEAEGKSCQDIGEVEVLKESFFAMLVDSWNHRNVANDLENPFNINGPTGTGEPTPAQVYLLEQTTMPVPVRDSIDVDPYPINISCEIEGGATIELTGVNRHHTIGGMKDKYLIDNCKSAWGGDTTRSNIIVKFGGMMLNERFTLLDCGFEEGACISASKANEEQLRQSAQGHTSDMHGKKDFINVSDKIQRKVNLTAVVTL